LPKLKKFKHIKKLDGPGLVLRPDIKKIKRLGDANLTNKVNVF
jgi:hypothetical protein